jgi:hypothetical protein
MLALTLKVIFLGLLLTACGEDRPPAPTEAEDRQLNEAEAMLNDVSANEMR